MTTHDATVPAPTVAGGDAPLQPGRRKAMTRALRAVTGAGAVLSGASRAAAGAQHVPVTPGPGAPPPDALRDPLLSLVHRATWGFTSDLYADAVSKGLDVWRDEQLDPASIDDSALDARLASFPMLSMSAAELIANYPASSNGDLVVANALRQARILRARYSGRQVFERVVEFWTDHLNIPGYEGPLRYLKAVDDREVIRTHALGRFRDLIGASAKSAAMLYYLDNYTNVAAAPNENYARELMELHTLGVNGGYDETDVVNVARCFTGWTFDLRPGPTQGIFVFDPTEHDTGMKTVLSTPIPGGGGQIDGEMVLDLLASHPSTAAHIASKMCAFFLTYDTPQATIDRVAAKFLLTDGDIQETLREVLSERSLVEANVWGNPRLKRPMHFVMAAVRGTGGDIANVRPLLEELRQMGHLPFAWSAPNGFPDSLGAWGSNLLPRWGFASRLMDGQVPGTTVRNTTIGAYLGGVPRTAAARAINLSVFGGRMSDLDLTEVQEFVDNSPVWNLIAAREAIAVALSLPSVQWS